MAIDSERVPAIRHPKERSMRLRLQSFSMGDWIWTGLYGSVMAVLVLAAGNFGSLLGAGLFTLWLVSMYVPKTKWDERIYQMPLSALRDFGLVLKRGYVWKERGKTWRSKRPVKPFPLEVRELGDVGLVYNQAKRNYNMIFSAEGSRITTYSALDQYLAMRNLSRVIAKAAAAAGRGGLKFGMGFRARPQDQWLIPNALSEVVDARIIQPVEVAAKPEAERTNEEHRVMWLHNFLREFTSMTEYTVDVGMFFVITVPDDKVFQKVHKAGELSDELERRLRTHRLRKLLVPALEQIIGPVEVLDGDGAERYLRMARDIATLDEYYDMVQGRREVGEDAEWELDHHVPTSHIRAGHDYVEIDGTFATTIKITSFPEPLVVAHDMQNMYDSATSWASISVIGETYNGGKEYMLRNGSSSLLDDAADTVGLIRGGAKAEKKAAEFNERNHEIVDAVFNQDYVHLTAILATSLEELQLEYELESDRLGAEGFGHMRVLGRSKQLSSFLTATTLIDLE
jgi:hypothetical protein